MNFKWSNGFTFRLVFLNNPEKYRDSCAQNLLLFSLTSLTNPNVVADMDKPQGERNSLWMRGHISLLATYRLAENYVYRTTATKIAKCCKPITLP
jgi:hypothetical protein